MKARRMILTTLLLSVAMGLSAWAGAFDDYYDYQNADGTYSYYFTGDLLPQGVFVTMDEDWYRNTLVKTGDRGATFYQKDSYDAYAAEGMEGGRLFTIGASVNTDFKQLPSFVYLGFDDESCMNLYVELPTDYQAYMGDEAVRAEYDALWAGVRDVIAGIRIGSEAAEAGQQETTDGNPGPGTGQQDTVGGTVQATTVGSVTKKDTPVSVPDEPAPAIITSGDYEYLVNEDGETITIREYLGSKNSVEIPSEIDGYLVTGLEGQAFSYSKAAHVSFPESIVSIGPRAFEYCELEEVTIPAGATVETCAFGYGDALGQVLVGEGAVIKSRAFGYCDNLETVVFAPGSRVEADAFEYCDALKKVILCGEVEVEEDAFDNCDQVELIHEEESAFENWTQPSSGGTTGNGDKQGSFVGGWSVKEDPTVTPEALAVFEQAMPDHDRVDHEAVALLATQLVAGTNYCFLVSTVMDEPNAQPSYQIVYIYADLQGNVQVLETQDITFGLSPSGEDTQPQPLPEGEHRITLTGDEDVFVDCPTSAKAGEKVTVQVVGVADGEVRLEVNGADIGTWEDWGTYSFTMPDEDVELCGWISTAGYPGA